MLHCLSVVKLKDIWNWEVLELGQRHSQLWMAEIYKQTKLEISRHMEYELLENGTMEKFRRGGARNRQEF